MRVFSILVFFCVVACGLCSRERCSCEETCRKKVKVCDSFDPKVEIVYSGTACECHKALPFRVEIPTVPKEVLRKHKYDIEIKKVEKKPTHRYIYNTKVVKPKVETEEFFRYPVKIYKSDPRKKETRYIYNTKVVKPKKECEVQLDGLVAKMDKIVLPVKDCLQPCCQKESSEKRHKKSNKRCESSEEIQETSEESSEEEFVSKKIKSCTRNSSCKCGKCSSEESEESIQIVSSEETVQDTSESSEENCSRKKVRTCTGRRNCGCGSCNSSSEESAVQESSEEIVHKPRKCTGRNNCGCGSCNLSSEESFVEESSEESCVKESSEEIVYKPKKCTGKNKCGCGSCNVSSEESFVEESSEEIIYKPRKCTGRNNCGCGSCNLSSEEIYEEKSSEESCVKESSEEIIYKPSKGKNCGCLKGSEEITEEVISQEESCETSEESRESSKELCSKKKCCGKKSCQCFESKSSEEEIVQETSSSESNSNEESGEYLPNRCNCGRPKVLYVKPRKTFRYEKNPLNFLFNKSSKNYNSQDKHCLNNKKCSSKEEIKKNRVKREFFLNNLQDYSKITEPLTKTEIEDILTKVKQENKMKKLKHRQEKKKRRMMNNNNGTLLDGEMLNTSTKISLGHILNTENDEDNPRNKRFTCQTIENLQNHPKYLEEQLIEAGCYQFLPEIVLHGSDKVKSRKSRKNMKKKNEDMYKEDYLHSGEENIKLSAEKGVCKCGCGLKNCRCLFNTNKNSRKIKKLKKSKKNYKKITYDNLGHKYFEVNGYKTLIKPNLEHIDSSFERTKPFKCSEDVINSEDMIQRRDDEEIPKENNFNLCQYIQTLRQKDEKDRKEMPNYSFIKNCEEYITFLISNATSAAKTNNFDVKITEFLQTLINNSADTKIAATNLLNTKNKLENDLANSQNEISVLLRTPNVVNSFKDYVKLHQQLEDLKNKLEISELDFYNFYNLIKDVLLDCNDNNN